MRINTLSISLIVLSAVALNHVALADPQMQHYTFVCPNTSGSSGKVVSRLSNTIIGYGSEFFNGNPTPSNPYFFGPIIEGSNIPLNLVTGSYVNFSTNYASATGKVSCNYASSVGFDPFSIAYLITNGQGGIITGSTANTMDIDVPNGLKA